MKEYRLMEVGPRCQFDAPRVSLEWDKGTEHVG